MNIVMDTNVIASAIYFGGKPLQFVTLALSNEIHPFVTESIIEEYERIVDELSQKYPKHKIHLSLTDLVNGCEIVTPIREITVCRDPDDNKFIECAVEADCLYIVSGDKDLLAVEQFEDIEILTVSEFFERYYKEKI